MKKQSLSAIAAMTDYLIDSEESNFFDCGCEDGHIFLDALEAAKWLSTQLWTNQSWAKAVKRIEAKIAVARSDVEAA